jgi:hypothetical protein
MGREILISPIPAAKWRTGAAKNLRINHFFQNF